MRPRRRRYSTKKIAKWMMNAGIDASDHFTIKTTILPNGICKSVTVTSCTLECAPRWGSSSAGRTRRATGEPEDVFESGSPGHQGTRLREPLGWKGLV